jgi:hypothetical protein
VGREDGRGSGRRKGGREGRPNEMREGGRGNEKEM